MEIFEYFESNDQVRWREMIRKCSWNAAGFLYELLCENRLRELCGETTQLFLLADGGSLVSFCTLAEQDEIAAHDMTPWIGFVYTFPEYRGKGYAAQLIEHACRTAKNSGKTEVFVSTDAEGLYEKYGFDYTGSDMKTVFGDSSRVYRRRL